MGSQDADFFLEAMQGYRVTKVLLVANELRIFDHLADGPKTAAEVAAAVNCDGRTTTLLLRALVSLGIVLPDGGRFSNSRIAARHLVKNAPGYLGHNLQFQETLWECWTHLEDVVRTGTPWRRLEDLLDDRQPEFLKNYIYGIDSISAAPAREVAEKLVTAPVRSLLDVGSGSGRYSVELLKRSPDARATLLDLPGPLGVARELTADTPEHGRLSFRAANYLEEPYGENLDLVLMSHVTHDESPAAVRDMVGRAFAALRPGGRLAIHDWVVDDATHREPRFAALFAVNLMVYSDGRVYSEAEYRGYLVDVGFGDVVSHSIGEGVVGNPTRLIVGSRPT